MRIAPEDFDTARTLLYDHLGVTAAGAQDGSALSVGRFSSAVYGKGPTLPVLGTDRSLPVLGAVMTNAVAAHSTEYDDVHNSSSSHPGVVVFPAALAAARLSGASAERFLSGAIVGYEVMCRIGVAANPSSLYARGFHPTPVIGVFGAAAAAAYVMEMPVGRTVSALGIAGSMAAGSMQFLVDGAWTKRLHPGLAARSGVEAAMLAQEGYRGTEDPLGGEKGFFASYCQPLRIEAMVDGWQERPLEIRATSIKAHTCCRYKQGGIDALLDIRARGGFSPSDISSVTVGLLSMAHDIVAVPAEIKKKPQGVVDAQFSMPYGAAVALSRGRAGLDEYQESLFSDPDITRLMDLTNCVVDPTLDEDYPAKWKTWAEVSTTDGRSWRTDVDYPKGDPDNPFTADELRDKFSRITTGIYSPNRQEEIAVATADLGTNTELEELIELLPSDLAATPLLR
jgi:2-methylcitrate dehydratase PrpD